MMIHHDSPRFIDEPANRPTAHRPARLRENWRRGGVQGRLAGGTGAQAAPAAPKHLRFQVICYWFLEFMTLLGIINVKKTQRNQGIPVVWFGFRGGQHQVSEEIDLGESDGGAGSLCKTSIPN